VGLDCSMFLLKVIKLRLLQVNGELVLEGKAQWRYGKLRMTSTMKMAGTTERTKLKGGTAYIFSKF